MTTPSSARRRYAVAGTGHRAQMYIDAMIGDHADTAELVAWCEPNPGRTAYYDELVTAAGGSPRRSDPFTCRDRASRDCDPGTRVTDSAFSDSAFMISSWRRGADARPATPHTVDDDGL